MSNNAINAGLSLAKVWDNATLKRNAETVAQAGNKAKTLIEAFASMVNKDQSENVKVYLSAASKDINVITAVYQRRKVSAVPLETLLIGADVSESDAETTKKALETLANSMLASEKSFTETTNNVFLKITLAQSLIANKGAKKAMITSAKLSANWKAGQKTNTKA